MSLIKELFNRQKYLEFKQDDKGLHQLGGNIPVGFTIPDNDFLGGLPYLGFISNEDKYFEWLPFPLHLICPILTDFHYILLDYENPNQPKLIYPHNSGEITSPHRELQKDSYIIYNKETFSLHPFRGITEENEFDIVAIAGKPHWTQSAAIPTCPRSKKKMKFVCQLMSNGPITAKEKNFKSEDDYYEKTFTELCFWDDGDLKVFFEPVSKVACYFIQNT